MTEKGVTQDHPDGQCPVRVESLGKGGTGRCNPYTEADPVT